MNIIVQMCVREIKLEKKTNKKFNSYMHRAKMHSIFSMLRLGLAYFFATQIAAAFQWQCERHNTSAQYSVHASNFATFDPSLFEALSRSIL